MNISGATFNDTKEYGIYITVSGDGTVVDIFSDSMRPPAPTDILLMKGVGMKYKYAQGYAAYDAYRLPVYSWVNGQLLRKDNSVKIDATKLERAKRERIKEIEMRLAQLSEDFVQAQIGAVFENFPVLRQEFIGLHNEIRVLKGKTPRTYD